MDLNEAFTNYFNNLHAVDISAYEIGLRLLVALIFSVLTCVTYVLINKGGQVSKKLMEAIVIISMTICMALIALSHSIPVSFGLFAALSIIRFRTPIKDLREICLIFISIVIGICCGIGALQLAMLGASSILTTYILMVKLNYLSPKSHSFLIQLETVKEYNQNEINQVMQSHCKDFEALEVQSFNENNVVIYEANLKDISNALSFSTELNQIKTVSKAHISQIRSAFENL